MTNAELQAKVTELEAQLKAATVERPITMKVSEKGALSLYGLGRFPMTAYASQWERIIGLVKSGKLEQFIAANKGTLTRK